MAQYLCKACRGVLNVKTSIILSATKLNSSKKGLLYLNPELGNYTVTTHPTFQIEEGEEYLINCPICHAHLNSLKYDHLVRIKMISGSTVEKIGPDAVKYDKYFDIPEEDKKYL